MALKLPKKFTDIDLGTLWEYVKIGDELIELSASEEDKAYWSGWHDCMASLFGDLTRQPTLTKRTELARLFENFRMENRLLQMEEEINNKDTR